ncbi:uncharacterized protein CLUP02_01547 [Colletotrichum lupini]|uniref:Uncharacterized protein n=1 Tax=Colletotrichum lupini TaxID=145971 RepID=A0A9Q8SCW9_9PEZI|nr:uncharacterized protein CLUP02_01547 [Colletotrichum lupini]KAK1706534.1 hypothetical protein BDP67DRAFT_529155 [Colletotrichum lupini]UQC74895.1 hypothetical protein CLUP02_01547 [Colletotrichum lupini]
MPLIPILPLLPLHAGKVTSFLGLRSNFKVETNQMIRSIPLHFSSYPSFWGGSPTSQLCIQSLDPAAIWSACFYGLSFASHHMTFTSGLQPHHVPLLCSNETLELTLNKAFLAFFGFPINVRPSHAHYPSKTRCTQARTRTALPPYGLITSHLHQPLQNPIPIPLVAEREGEKGHFVTLPIST